MAIFDKISVAQINLTVGDLAGNAQKIIAAAKHAKASGAELVVFPELAVSGYPPEDLLLRPAFIKQEAETLKEIAKLLEVPAIVGALHSADGKLYNGAYLLQGGKVKLVSTKKNLPNYGVFDEQRYFASGDVLEVFEIAGHKLAVIVCEDGWTLPRGQEAKEKGAELLLSINASPYEFGKIERRYKVFGELAQVTKLPIIYTHMVGGQDEIVFDGASFVLDAKGKLTASLPEFEEIIAMPNALVKPLPKLESQFKAMVLGLRDYVRKTGFQRVVLGLSGGIDSALVAAIAAEALGGKNVRCIILPSKFSSQTSLNDAEACAKSLGVNYETINIEPAVQAFHTMLKDNFAGKTADATEENLQSRARGITLMASSNKHHELLLTTGNKSEMAVGYATLYGDMNGAFNPIKDLYKTEVFEVARWLGSIPANIISKEPTAELRENQKDSDSLPTYDVLDGILRQLIEGRKVAHEVQGFDAELVKKIARLVKNSEFKRKQAPMGVKLTACSFGKDWRYQVASY